MNRFASTPLPVSFPLLYPSKGSCYSKQALFLKLFGMTLLFLVIIAQSTLPVHAIERRKDQFYNAFNYIIVPAPYSLPGLGQGIVYFASVNNIYESYLDVYGYLITGDVDGYGYGISDLHLFPRTLLLELGGEDIQRVSVTQYDKRGMDTGKDDFQLLEAGNYHSRYGTLYLTLLDRRFDLYASFFNEKAELYRIRDNQGDLIADFEEPQKHKGESITFGFLIDYTDDRADPRVGARLDISRRHSPTIESKAADYFVMDYNATGYIPLGRLNTMVFNIFRSDAVVVKEGETDKTTIREETGLYCEYLVDLTQQTECIEAREKLVNDTYASRKYGTATRIGGRERLRSYPHQRFSGAHAMTLGAEFRWNFLEEFIPFDLYFWKDVRTGLQAAVFYEIGSVSETNADLWKETRDSYGVGGRMIMASGLVYRLDWATGDEGANVTMIVNYPW